MASWRKRCFVNKEIRRELARIDETRGSEEQMKPTTKEKVNTHAYTPPPKKSAMLQNKCAEEIRILHSVHNNQNADSLHHPRERRLGRVVHGLCPRPVRARARNSIGRTGSRVV